MRTVIVLTVFWFVSVNALNNSDFVFTHKMAQACKEHMCKEGYNYDKIYSVDSEELKEIRKDSEIAFEMHIAIQAMSNGHILLSPVPRPGPLDPVYEIVVGGGGNKFTELRRHLKRDARSSVKTPGILSTFELRGFYIKIDQSGIIEFGREGEIALLTYLDVTPLDIKYFAFAAWAGVEAKFLYDCPIPTKDGGEITANSQEVEQISPSDSLKRELLHYKLPWVSPKQTMDVRLGVKVTSAKYNAFQSKLVTTMSVVVSWTDDTMAWYPNKYDGTTSLKFRQGQIWRPKFYVFNSDDQALFDARNSELVTIESTGEATFHFQTKVFTWCHSPPPGLSKWPHDEYECTIVIQPWEVHDRINLDIVDPRDSRMKIFTNMDGEAKNEWDFVSKQLVVPSSTWNDVYKTGDNVTHMSDRLIINVVLKRTATAYNLVFYTPLLVLVMFILFAFLSEPLTMTRVWFFAGCSIVISMGLCYIDYLIPCHTLPSILVLYTVVLAGVLIALLVQVILMTTAVEKFCSTNFMHSLFTMNLFRFICCLPAVKMSINGGYSLQEDDEPATTRGADVEEMERDKQRSYCDKRELAEVIDKIMFVVYSFGFAIMLAAHF